MTYRSSYNPTVKTDYNNFAFKKSEILEILKGLNSNFSFDSPDVNKQENNEVLNTENSINARYNYKFLLFKKPLLTFHEAACIMTGYDPQYVEQCQNDTNFKQNFSDYLGAYDYINTFTDTDLLSYDNNYRLYLKEFKSFLSNENIIIDDFNDELKDSELSKKDQNAEILRLSQIITEKDIEIKKLKQDIEKEQSASFDSWLDQAKAEKEANELQERIKKLEEVQAVEKSESNNLLALIFDETATERYAPDLVSSIMLWEYIYITNPKNDSHSNKADTWLGKNTGYDTAKKQGSASKIREITTPFVNWGNLRDKNHQK
mgnify:FL=1